MPARQEEATGVVGQRMQPAVAHADVSSVPGVSGATLPGRCGEARRGGPVLAPARRMPQGFTKSGRGARAMVGRHRMEKARLVAGHDRIDDGLAQVHALASLRMGRREPGPGGRETPVSSLIH